MNKPAELLTRGSFSEIRQCLDEQIVSSVQLSEEALRRAKDNNDKWNSYISYCEDLCLSLAHEADKAIQRGQQKPLCGIPIAIKDLILVKDYKCTAASKMLENFVAPYDATVTTSLKNQLCPIVGKTNLDEFAMGSSNESSFFGATRNPWNPSRVPGGSSGGSGAAIASRTTILSLGTDTGGSIRQPSSLCGITGLKPSYGRVSRYGAIAFASSLDQIGPMCSDALGCAAVLDCISGEDIHDATTESSAPGNFYESLLHFRNNSDLKNTKIGIPKEFFAEGLNSEVKKSVEAAIQFFEKNGAKLIDIELPHNSYSLSSYYIICTAECSSNLARYDGIHIGHRSQKKNLSLEALYSQSRAEGFGKETQLRILLGTYALSSGYYDAYFQKAAKVRRLIKEDFDQAFEKVDVIMGPTAPTTAFELGQKQHDPLSMYMNDIYTLSTNLAGLPGLSLNVGFDKDKLPIGLQILAPRWKEDRILKLADFYQTQNPNTLVGAPL